jgi:hypothetical protein
MTSANLWAGGSRIAVTCALLVAACSDEDLSRPATGVRSAQESEDASASTTWTRASDDVCDAREQENRDWAKGYLGCERDVDCEITEIAAECLSPFLCSTVLSTKIDRAAFEIEAKKRQNAYEPECGCAEADCVPPSSLEAYCDSATKLCALSHRRAASAAP